MVNLKRFEKRIETSKMNMKSKILFSIEQKRKNKTYKYMTNTKTTRKNKQWLRSRDQRKHPKMFTVNMVQLPNGQFHIVGKGANVMVKKNQHSVQICPVDVRDLATEMRMNGVTSF